MFAIVLTLCTFASCNSYFIDKADSKADCMVNLVSQADDMATVWHDDKRLAAMLKRFNIETPVGQLNDYDYTCEVIDK